MRSTERRRRAAPLERPPRQRAADPDRNQCVVPCCHCGIRFLTDPRNAGRLNLRCPFGCREHHRKQCSNQRSHNYRQTLEGREKKELLNAQRSLRVNLSVGDQPTSDDEFEPDEDLVREDSVELPTAEACSSESRQESASGEHAGETPLQLPLEGLTLDEASVVNSPMLPYVRMVASLIEGRRIGAAELIDALRKRVRQHSMALRTRGDYVLDFLNQHPP